MIDTVRRLPIQILANTLVKHNTKHQKIFGCPVYVLDNSIQQRNIFHTRITISIVLDITNGLVSPKFQVEHDSYFDTIRQERYKSSWQIQEDLTVT